MSHLLLIPALKDAEPIFTIIGTVGGLISLIYVAIQIKDNTNAAKGNAYQNMINSMAQFESIIIQNQEVAKLYHKGINGEKLSEIEQIRFNELLSTWFNYFENFYFQHKKKLIDNELWIGWKENMLMSLEKEPVRQWWNDRQVLYSSNFRKMIAEGLDKR